MVLGGGLMMGIAQAFFLAGLKLWPLKMEFDAENLYITDKNGDRTVRLKDIVFMKLVYTSLQSRVSRRYRIGFGDPYAPDEVVLSIYPRNFRAYRSFRELVTQKNPSMEIVDSATNIDGILNWFRRRRS